jgi:glycosyltransferase involved in cell wall biosynthesis
MNDVRHEEQLPLVTVAMPIFNAGKLLRLAVLSIVKQTYTNWELLIIDDGSTDNALEYISDIKDARIRISRDGLNKGLAARLNECIQVARGEYLARMDQDDVSYPERFAKQVARLQSDPDLDLVAACAITINEKDQLVGRLPSALLHEEICARPWVGFYLPHPSWMAKIQWFRAHRYASPAPYFCEDQELLLRSYRVSRFATLADVLLAYRISSVTNWRKLFKTRKAVLGIQSNYFVKEGQWHFVLLSMLVFVGRITADLCKMIGRVLFQYQSKCSLPHIYYSRWTEVKGSFSTYRKEF